MTKIYYMRGWKDHSKISSTAQLEKMEPIIVLVENTYVSLQTCVPFEPVTPFFGIIYTKEEEEMNKVSIAGSFCAKRGVGQFNKVAAAVIEVTIGSCL
jgi:hypothetical protein